MKKYSVTLIHHMCLHISQQQCIFHVNQSCQERKTFVQKMNIKIINILYKNHEYMKLFCFPQALSICTYMPRNEGATLHGSLKNVDIN